jgi:FkbH-like protein
LRAQQKFSLTSPSWDRKNPTISELNLFEITSFSETDLNRSELYRIEAQRNDLKAKFENLDDYLDSLQMTADIERFNDFNLARIVQLMLRSNQFNLKTNRYSESDCISFMNDMDCNPFTVSLSDRYGSHGLICVSVVQIQNSDVIIQEFLMSCRVLKRGVEELALNHIFDFARGKNIKRVIGLYEPTEKNSMVKDFYQKYGFQLLDTQDNTAERWVLEVSSFQDLPNHITAVKPS